MYKLHIDHVFNPVLSRYRAGHSHGGLRHRHSLGPPPAKVPAFHYLFRYPNNFPSQDHVGKKRKKKRVHFAEDVVDPTGNSEDYRKLRSSSGMNNITWGADSSENIKNPKSKVAGAALLKKGVQEMPANRVALYNGILRDRVHKMRTSSY